MSLEVVVVFLAGLVARLVGRRYETTMGFDLVVLFLVSCDLPGLVLGHVVPPCRKRLARRFRAVPTKTEDWGRIFPPDLHICNRGCNPPKPWR